MKQASARRALLGEDEPVLKSVPVNIRRWPASRVANIGLDFSRNQHAVSVQVEHQFSSLVTDSEPTLPGFPDLSGPLRLTRQNTPEIQKEAPHRQRFLSLRYLRREALPKPFLEGNLGHRVRERGCIHARSQ